MTATNPTKVTIASGSTIELWAQLGSPAAGTIYFAGVPQGEDGTGYGVGVISTSSYTAGQVIFPLPNGPVQVSATPATIYVTNQTQESVSFLAWFA